jgi:hypothetical protein
MSQTFFSKLDPLEKMSRLGQLGLSKGQVTVWIKGQKEKHLLNVLDFDKERSELVLDSKDNFFPLNANILCTFDLRGMTFFSQVTLLKSLVGFNVIQFKQDLFKSERRSSYRLLTYPIYDVWSEFDLGESYEGGNVVDLKSKTNQTGLFKNFLKIVEGKEEEAVLLSKLKIRVQDLSVTGMAIHIGELETKYFSKGVLFKDVNILFQDELILIPEVKVMYVVDYIAGDKKLKKYKVGLHFPNLPTVNDTQLGNKINKLLREIDFNKDFENFLK